MDRTGSARRARRDSNDVSGAVSRVPSPRAARFVTIVSLLVLLGTGGMLVPQFNQTRRQLRERALQVDLDCLNQAVKRYATDHGGTLPGLEDGMISPDMLRRQLTLPSTTDGEITPNGPFGPYLKAGIPPNPWNDSSEMKVVTAPNLPPPDGTTGWVLHVPGGVMRLPNGRIASNARTPER
jgi:type II secretory pathway pseudopilin PulG